MKDFFKKIGSSITSTEIRNILGIVIVLGCFYFTHLLFTRPIPKDNENTVNVVVGFVFGGALAGVTGFYFGASKKDIPTNDNNDDKNKTLNP